MNDQGKRLMFFKFKYFYHRFFSPTKFYADFFSSDKAFFTYIYDTQFTQENKVYNRQVL